MIGNEEVIRNSELSIPGMIDMMPVIFDNMLQCVSLVHIEPDEHDLKRLLLVQSCKYTPLTLPGGKVEEGESAEDALRREIRQELGCEIEGLSVYRDFFGGTIPTPTQPRMQMKVSGFFGTLVGEPKPSSEIVAIEWIFQNDLKTRARLSEVSLTMFDALVRYHYL